MTSATSQRHVVRKRRGRDSNPGPVPTALARRPFLPVRRRRRRERQARGIQHALAKGRGSSATAFSRPPWAGPQPAPSAAIAGHPRLSRPPSPSQAAPAGSPASAARPGSPRQARRPMRSTPWRTPANGRARRGGVSGPRAGAGRAR